MGTVALCIFLRKKRIKEHTSPSYSSPPTISLPSHEPTREASFPDVRITYEDASGNQTERKITPFHRSASGVIAQCHLRNDERTFRLDRIRAVHDSLTGKALAKDVWFDSLPKLESEEKRSDAHIEQVIRVTIDIQSEGIRMSVDESPARVRNSIAERPITTDQTWPSDSIKGMVPKPGSFDDSLFVDPNTGKFKFPNYRDNKKYLVEIRDETDYREQFWNHLDREEKRQYNLDRFNWDIESGGLIIEVEGFLDLFKPENRQKFSQFQMLFHLNLDALLETSETNHQTSEFDLLWVAPSDPAYEAVRDGYLERVTTVEAIDCWRNLKVSEIKKVCTTAGVRVSNKKKDELIRELMRNNIQYPNEASLPHQPSPKCRQALDNAISTYIEGVKENADRFHPTYIAYIWDAAIDANSPTYVSQAIRNAISDQYWLGRMQSGVL